MPPLGIGNSIRPENAGRPPPSNVLVPQKPETQLEVSGSDVYSPEEIAVLKRGSRINGREYVPFMAVDLRERFAYPMPFVDKDGQLALALKQKQVRGIDFKLRH